MSRVLTCALAFYVVPAVLLNPLGQPAFVGYYLGVLTVWLVILTAGGRDRREAQPDIVPT